MTFNTKQSRDLELSIVIPVKDEAETINGLAGEIDRAMSSVSYEWECVWVDDGSTDSTLSKLEALNRQNPCHQYVILSKNYGQSAALIAGFDVARGRLLATLDGDGQNDPRDLPGLAALLMEKNADMVNGVRRKRQDSFVRKISSKIGNGFRNILTGEQITDVGCSIRVFKYACVRHLPSFKGMHRFLPTLLRIGGCSKILEMPVNHRPREFGETKYGIKNRLWVGIVDTLAVRWMKSRMVGADIRRTSSLLSADDKKKK